MTVIDKNVKKCNNTVKEVFSMKSTGIVRGLDKMGRIVLPMEVRRLLHLVDDKSFVEFYTEEDAVILKKYVPACVFCDNADDMIEFGGMKICKNCLKKMNQIVNETEQDSGEANSGVVK